MAWGFGSSGGADSTARWSILAWPGCEEPTPPWDLERPLGDAESSWPFRGGWIGWIDYDLGEVFEPAASRSGSTPHASCPRARWWRCDDALLYDHGERRWWAIGEPPMEPSAILAVPAGRDPGFRAGPLRSLTGRLRYTRLVAEAIERIRAGEVYQVNLAHELSGPFEGSTRRAFAAMHRVADPGFGAYFEADDPDGRRLAVLSASPELFLDVSPSGVVTTRPMKGTRPGLADERELLDADKDRAELNMIIDLMRNDLGRVCRFGSVRVGQARTIERHGGLSTGGVPGGAGVIQATGTVSGVLRAGVGLGDLIRACFPGGSVTGAPKIQAMRIINELEASRRGVYCGAIGMVGDDGRAQFSIAIRTAVVTGDPAEPLDIGDRGNRGAASMRGNNRAAGSSWGVVAKGRLSYRVGAGVVADSNPAAEWDETLVKAGPARAIAGIDENPAN